MFITGQKVVCIDGTFPEWARLLYITLPIKDVVYVVRGLAPGVGLDMEPEIAVYLIGLRNPLSNVAPFRERGFRCERFRPLDIIELVNEAQKSTDAYAEAWNRELVEIGKESGL